MHGNSFYFKIQFVMILLAAAAGVSLYVFVLPEFEETCCIHGHVTRTDLGRCNDPASKISSEVVGLSSVKKECEPYTKASLALYCCTYGALFIAIVIHLMQIDDAHSVYLETIRAIATRISPDVSKQKIIDSYSQAILYTADIIVTTASEGDNFKKIYWYPESMLLGYPLLHFHSWVWVLAQFLLSILIVIPTMYFFFVEEKLYQAWGRCYPEDTPDEDLDHGMCTKTLYKHHTRQFIPIFIASASLVIKGLLYYFGYKSSVLTRSNYESHIEKKYKHVSPSDKAALIACIIESRSGKDLLHVSF
jgi:hypothetical protein